MKRVSYWPYFSLFVFFALLFSTPQKAAHRTRSMIVSSLAPCWRGLDALRGSTTVLLSLPFSSRQAKVESGDQEPLLRENAQLKMQMAGVKQWLSQEGVLREQVRQYASLLSQEEDFFYRRADEVKRILQLEAASLPAQVIFRAPSSWSSSVWINVGEESNERLKERVVCKNSPVVVGSCVVGVIEYVGAKQSLVRLITDSSLAVSVRAKRGEEPNRHLFSLARDLLHSLKTREDLFHSEEEKEVIFDILQGIKTRCEGNTPDLYLAKGELKGSRSALWRSRDLLLKGVGFNYDFADQEGPSRDLRSGESYGASHKKGAVRLIQEGDLLVTTGLDRLFPSGLKVAHVEHVEPLKEGASAYEVKARALVDLDSLSSVFVLPPLNS